jgi:arabinofuranosyltransferase
VGRNGAAVAPPGARLTWIVAAFVLALGVFLFRQFRIAGALGPSAFPLDDSWIHLHFARNLAEGHGFAYNPGHPVAGSTAPLWTLLLGAAFGLFGSHPPLAKALGAAASLATAFMAGRLTRRWTGDPALGLLAGVLTALAGPLAWGALSGMEVSLAALLVTGALLCLDAGRTWPAALLLGLAALARPEALLLLPLAWLAGPATIRRAAVLGGIVAAALAPWVAFNLMTAGTPLPATAAAKIEGGLLGLLAGRRESLVTALVTRPWEFEREWAAWLYAVNAILPFLILPGLWALWRHRGRFAAVPALLLLLHPLGMALLAPYRGPRFQEGRYSIHLLPMAIAVAVAALGLLRRPGATRVSAPRAGPGAAVVGLALVAASLVALWPAAGRYGRAVQNIEAMQVHLGRWVARETRPEARLALNDVGAIAYRSRREVVDVMGLVTPAIIPYRREGDAGILRYLERACPDYLIVFPSWFPELSGRTELFTPVYRVRLDDNLVAGADEMVVYETVWNRWKPGRQSCRPAL